MTVTTASHPAPRPVRRPGPARLPGTAAARGARPAAQALGRPAGLLSDAADEYGDVVRFDMGPKTLYFFNHPDHAKHVLADNAANYHKGMGLAEARRRSR